MLTLAGAAARDQRRMRASSPTRITSVSGLRRAQSTAPATTSSGRMVAAHGVDRDAHARLRQHVVPREEVDVHCQTLASTARRRVSEDDAQARAFGLGLRA